MDKKFPEYPAWRYGPNGDAKVFARAEDVPAGWQDHPSKAGGVTQSPTSGGVGDPGSGSLVNPGLGSGGDGGNAEKNPRPDNGAQPGGSDRTDTHMTAEYDAAGWPWDANLHAATKTMTKDGLWRMKVGVSRPAPKPGFMSSQPSPGGTQPGDLDL